MLRFYHKKGTKVERRGDKPIGGKTHTHTHTHTHTQTHTCIFIDTFHKETPFIASFISNKQICHVSLFVFFLFYRRAEQVLPMGKDWHQWEGGGGGERR
jgi:hypothetical protein